MPINKFTTLLDLSRQAKIITGETATFDGKIEAGIPFSGYPTGVDTGTTVSLGIISSQDSIFSGNTGTTLFDVSNVTSPNYSSIFSGYTATTWTNPIYSAYTSGLTLPITTISADTQIVGTFWTLTQTGYTGDYIIGTQYTGFNVTYSFNNVSQFGTGDTYSGITTATIENFSAGTLDYKGPLDYLQSVEDATIDGRLYTNKITISNGASSATTNYVLTQIDDTGSGEWNSISSLLSGSCHPFISIETISGCSISGLTIDSDVTVNGDVTINGSATTINTEVIQSKDNNIILNYSGTHVTAIGGGITLEDGVSNGVNSKIFSNSDGAWLFDPSLSASSISAVTIGDSGNCVSDIYVSKIHSCSPLEINPLDEGDIVVGSNNNFYFDVTNSRIGINKIPSAGALDFSHPDANLIYRPTSNVISFTLSGDTNKTIYHQMGDSNGSILIGKNNGASSSADGGGVNDTYIYTIGNSNSLNISTTSGFTGGDKNIKFYAGQGAITASTPDIHIQGTGATRGYVGFGTANPSYNVDILGNLRVFNNSSSNFYTNLNSAGGTVAISGSTNIPRFGIIIPPYLSYPNASASFGVRTWDDSSFPEYGKIGDTFLRASNESNGLNFVNSNGTGTEDYIRFYAGRGANTGTADIHIQGSGLTKGYVGIGTETPDSLLTVNGKTKTTTFQLTNGATNGYVLTSDASGNATWQVGGGSGTFTGGTVSGLSIFTAGLSANTMSAVTIGDSGNCVTDLYVTNLHSCSPLNINPLNEGDIIIGSNNNFYFDVTNKKFGVGKVPTLGDIDFSSTYGNFIWRPALNYNTLTVSGGSNNGQVITASNDVSAITLGQNGSGFTLNPTRGVGNDSYIECAEANNLNIITTSGGTVGQKSIRFYAGLTTSITASTPSIHIGGSGSTKGFIGINNPDPRYLLEIKYSGSTLYYDPSSTGGRLNISGTTGLPRYDISIPAYLTKPTTGGSFGIRTWDNATSPGYGKVGDMHLYAGDQINGLNIINRGPGTSTEDYIRFYAGQDANGTVADIHIGGSGATRGYVGIGTETPDSLLTVNGKTKTTTFQLTNGATNGYVLTSDASGNATWQVSSGGGSSVTTATTTTINFTGQTIYYNATSPATGNISENLTGASLGQIQKIYHNDTSEPAFPGGWVLMGDAIYFTSTLNIIYAEWAGGSRVEYWYVQEQ